VKKAEPADSEAEAKKKTFTESQTPSAATSGTGTAAKTGGGGTASEFGWYHDLIHDRFFSQWDQPTSIFEQDKSFVSTVKIHIGRDGSIKSAQIVRGSGNPLMDQSVLAAIARVSKIDPPPTGLGSGDGYTVNINFELQ
jgi:TolA protein